MIQLSPVSTNEWRICANEQQKVKLASCQQLLELNPTVSGEMRAGSGDESYFFIWQANFPLSQIP